MNTHLKPFPRAGSCWRPCSDEVLPKHIVIVQVAFDSILHKPRGGSWSSPMSRAFLERYYEPCTEHPPLPPRGAQ